MKRIREFLNSHKVSVTVASLAVIALVLASFVVYFERQSQAASLVFADEFNSAPLNTSVWKTTTVWGARVNPGAGEQQYYADSALSFVNGGMRITSSKQAVSGYPYTSGSIVSLNRAKFNRGFFELRGKLPKGKGMWPAFWLTNDATHEIDVFELLGNDPTTVYMTYHRNSSQVYQAKFTGPDFSAGYHTFAVDWQPTYIRWYIDGVKRGEYTGTNLADGLYIVANTAVGGNWPGSPDATTVFPQYYDIDYIRAYDAMGTVTTPIGDTTPPTVNLAAPTSGSTVSGTTSLIASATDNVGVSKVDYYDGPSYIGTTTAAPYVLSWDTTKTTNGSHSISARAYDAANNVGASAISTVVVSNQAASDTVIPVVNVSAPQNGSTLASRNVTVVASATDNVSVASMQVFLDDKLVATVTGANITKKLQIRTTGTHRIVVRAIDRAGNTGSTTVTVYRQ